MINNDILKWQQEGKSLADSKELLLAVDSTTVGGPVVTYNYHDSTSEVIANGATLLKVGVKNSTYGCTYFNLSNNDIRFIRTEDTPSTFTEIDSITIDELNGIIDVIGEYRVDGVRVVTNRQTDPTDSTTILIVLPADTPATADALRDDLVTNTIPSIQTDIDLLKQKINSVLQVLRNHGLV
jgi:hypothetical protein